MCTLAADLTPVLNIQGPASIYHKNPFVLPQLDVILQSPLQSEFKINLQDSTTK